MLLHKKYSKDKLTIDELREIETNQALRKVKHKGNPKKLEYGEIEGIKFCYRKGYSDIVCLEEQLREKSYLKKGMTIEKNELWLDGGGNIGAFALLAISKGADVVIYEADALNCEIIEKNLKLNGYRAEIRQEALIAADKESVLLNIALNNNVWRNSIFYQWGGEQVRVPAVQFEDVAGKFDCVKLDIEGAEMSILEKTNHVFDKLVYEWSFDIDNRLPRLWNVLDKQKKDYHVEWKGTIRYEKRDHARWESNWFPPIAEVYCFRK